MLVSKYRSTQPFSKVWHMVFSVADYSVWEIFPWRIFALFYAIALVLIAYPKSSGWWPLSSFSLLAKLGRWNGIATFCFVSVIAVPHFLETANPLNAQKRALETGQYSNIEATYDGQKPDKKVAWATFPETDLSFGGAEYEVPGSLHGSVDLLPKIRSQLTPGDRYRLSISDNVILRIETVS